MMAKFCIYVDLCVGLHLGCYPDSLVTMWLLGKQQGPQS